MAYAQSIVPAVDGTGTQVTQAGSQITVNGGQLSRNGRNLFHSFTDFGLSRGQTANFLANPTIQNILTRVTGGNASVIDGLIQVSGGSANFFLMNPAGILFGANARLNVPGSFLATTANGIGLGGNQWFNAVGTPDYAQLTGHPIAFAFTTPTPGAIANLGNLTVPPGQSLTLLAGSILNTGQLVAPGGQVTVMAVPGQNLVRLSQPGSVLSLEIQAIADGTDPSQALPAAPSLPQLLTGGTVESASQVTVNPDGSVRLTGSNLNLPTTAGTSLISGQVSVQQTTTPTPGSINLLGQTVALVNATVDASGLQGGTIRIGGDYHGQGTIPTAERTLIDSKTVIRANGLNSTELGTAPADGGRVIVWSDRTTQFYGTIEAKGGDLAGAGGFVEVSGKQNLLYRGQTDVAAPAGQAGTLVLDPENIFIVPATDALNDSDFISNNNQIAAFDFPGTFTLSQSVLEQATGDIILEATNNIEFQVPSGTTIAFDFFANSVTFRADADGVGVGSFIAPGVNLQTAGDTTTTISISGHSVTVGNVDTSSSLTDGGDVTLSANTTIQSGHITTRSQAPGGTAGDVTVLSSGNITTGNISTTAPNNGVGGEVFVYSDQGSVVVGQVSTGGALSSGPVTLAAQAAQQNLRFTTIDTGSSAGIGGDVLLAAGQFVRGTGTLSGNGATIFTAGAIAPGSVIIGHGGEALGVPFVVGGTSPNGLAGGIVTGIDDLSASPPQIFQTDYTSPTGLIQILGSGTYNPDWDTAFEDEESDADLEEDGDFNLYTDADAAESLDQDSEQDLEDEYTDEFEYYLELPEEEKPNSLNSEQRLQQIQSITGVRPALVYLNYVPASVATDLPNNGTPIRRWQQAEILRFDPPLTKMPTALAVDRHHTNPFIAQAESSDRRPTQPSPHKRATVPAAQPTDQLEVLVVTAEGQPIRKLVAGATRAQVQATVKQFLAEISDPRRTRSRNYLKPAQQLYRWLIQPIEAQLSDRKISNLAFIAETGLRFVPLAALHDGKQFLIEKYSIGLMPSLSLTDTRFVSLKEAPVLAMGASEFISQAALPAVPTELSLITRQIRKGRSFLNQEFTLDNLKTQRQQEAFKIVHLATHGEFQAGALNNSYIQLWDTQLRLDQMRQLGWNNPPVELLVLSACRTALGNDEAELGFAGFAVQSGVKSAIASLWSVSDEGTLGLMTEFYRQLKTAPIRAEALRQAQIAMAQGKVRFENGRLKDSVGEDIPVPESLVQGGDRDLSHPYYWAAFTMIGSPW